MEILLRILAGAEQLFLWNSARPQKIFGVSERLNKVRGDSYGSTVTESEASGISPHLCHQKESSPLKRNFLAMLCSKHKSCQYYGIPITKWKNSQKMNKGEWESMSILPEDGTCCYFQQQKKIDKFPFVLKDQNHRHEWWGSSTNQWNRSLSPAQVLVPLNELVIETHQIVHPLSSSSWGCLHNETPLINIPSSGCSLWDLSRLDNTESLAFGLIMCPQIIHIWPLWNYPSIRDLGSHEIR